MKIATGDEAKAIHLTEYIRKWKPAGWKEPLHIVMFCPTILTEDYRAFKKGDFSKLEKERYSMHFIPAAKEFLENE